jgi:hypothetical protein
VLTVVADGAFGTADMRSMIPAWPNRPYRTPNRPGKVEIPTNRSRMAVVGQGRVEVFLPAAADAGRQRAFWRPWRGSWRLGGAESVENAVSGTGPRVVEGQTGKIGRLASGRRGQYKRVYWRDRAPHTALRPGLYHRNGVIRHAHYACDGRFGLFPGHVEW